MYKCICNYHSVKERPMEHHLATCIQITRHVLKNDIDLHDMTHLDVIPFFMAKGLCFEVKE